LRRHEWSDAAVDFESSDADMQTLKNLPQIEESGEDSVMPVFGVRSRYRRPVVRCSPGNSGRGPDHGMSA